jgi:energy-coupling factor transport system ATP-binding protein
MSGIELEHVGFIYGRGTPFEKKALDDVSFAAGPGTVTGIIGHTGSGKSTLVRLLNGLERPTSGRVLLDGRDIWEKPRKIGALRFRVGLVMQYPEYQLFDETVYADIAFGPKNMKLGEDEIDRRVRHYAAVAGLSADDLGRSPFDLSGGQKRRAAIAGIMAMEPEILVLDEPAAGLDPEGRATIFGAIDAYRLERSATVIIVSHSMEDMAERCDSIVILKEGRLFDSGTRGEVFSHPERLVEAGLDMPEITRLSVLLSEAGLPVGTQYTVRDLALRLASLRERRDLP